MDIEFRPDVKRLSPNECVDLLVRNRRIRRYGHKWSSIVDSFCRDNSLSIFDDDAEFLDSVVSRTESGDSLFILKRPIVRDGYIGICVLDTRANVLIKRFVTRYRVSKVSGRDCDRLFRTVTHDV